MKHLDYGHKVSIEETEDETQCQVLIPNTTVNILTR